MDMDRMDELARDPRFISGIYNYCDAWCERCAFTARCLTYATAREIESGGAGSRDAENEAFWDRLHETFEATMETVEDEPEEMDFDFDDGDFDDFLDEQEQVREAARSHPCSRIAMRYMEVADQWLKAHEALLGDKGDEREPPAPADNAAGLRDCLEVIRWYQSFVYVKLCRAADGAIRAGQEDSDLLSECMQGDADGSAKIALIGIERSIAAWATVREHFPDHEDAIFSLATLKRLLRQVDAAFPNARSFRRPGFDTEESPD